MGLATRGAGGHLVLVAHDHQEGGRLFVVLLLDEGTDGSGAGADFIGVVDVQEETLRGLPSIPRLQAFLEHTVGDDQHVDWVLPEVGVLVIHVVAPVEHLTVDIGEVRAEGTGELVVGCGLVVLAIAHFDFDVVVDANAVGGGVILHGVDRQGADLDATHRAFDLHLSDGTLDEAFGIVGLLVVCKRNVAGFLVLAEWHLLRIDRLDAKVGEGVHLGGVVLHLNGDIADAVRDGDQFVDCRQGGVTQVARRIGVFHGNVGESTFFSGDFSSVDAAEGEGGCEAFVSHAGTTLCRLGSAEFDVLGHHLGAKQQTHHQECCAE